MVYTWMSLEPPPDWTASHEDLLSLFETLEVSDVEAALVNLLTNEERLASTVLGFMQATELGWTSYTIVYGSTTGGGWVSQLYEWLEHEVPVDIGGSWAPWELLLSFSSLAHDRTQVAVSAGGDGAPRDFEEYLAIASRSEPIQSLQSWLHRRSGLGWSIDLTVE